MEMSGNDKAFARPTRLGFASLPEPMTLYSVEKLVTARHICFY